MSALASATEPSKATRIPPFSLSIGSVKVAIREGPRAIRGPRLLVPWVEKLLFFFISLAPFNSLGVCFLSSRGYFYDPAIGSTGSLTGSSSSVHAFLRIAGSAPLTEAGVSYGINHLTQTDDTGFIHI